MASSSLKIAWISDFPIEWLDGLPSPLAGLPRQHPLTWQRGLLEELEGRPELELHVVVLRKGTDRDVSFERNGVRFHVLRTLGLTRAPTLFWSDTLRIGRALAAVQPDLLHAWGTERGAALAGLRLAYPCLITIQGLLSWYRTEVRLKPLESLAAWLETHTLRRARHVTTESAFAVRFLRQRHPHLRVHQAEHAPSRLFAAVNRRPQTSPVRLLFTGHLDRRKGADVLFEALNELCGEIDFDLAHAGSVDGTLIAQARRRTRPDLWKRYRPAGKLPREGVAEELARAALLVLPTRADTSPNAVKEAVVAGVPVVATAVGGIPDYVVHGENGWLIPRADSAALADAIRAVHQHPLLGRGEVAPATLERMRDYLSPGRMAERFLAVYEAVMKERAAS